MAFIPWLIHLTESGSAFGFLGIILLLYKIKVYNSVRFQQQMESARKLKILQNISQIAFIEIDMHSNLYE